MLHQHQIAMLKKIQRWQVDRLGAYGLHLLRPACCLVFRIMITGKHLFRIRGQHKEAFDVVETDREMESNNRRYQVPSVWEGHGFEPGRHRPQGKQLQRRRVSF